MKTQNAATSAIAMMEPREIPEDDDGEDEDADDCVMFNKSTVSKCPSS